METSKIFGRITLLTNTNNPTFFLVTSNRKGFASSIGNMSKLLSIQLRNTGELISDRIYIEISQRDTLKVT